MSHMRTLPSRNFRNFCADVYPHLWPSTGKRTHTARLHVETKGAWLNTLVACYHPTSLKLRPLFFTHAKDKRACNKLCVCFGSNTFTVSTSNMLNIRSFHGYPFQRPKPFTCQFIKVCCDPFLNQLVYQTHVNKLCLSFETLLKKSVGW